MRLDVRIIEPVPPNIKDSYPPLGFYKFGLLHFIYGGFRGPVHWINAMLTCHFPEYPNPTDFIIYCRPGVLYTYHAYPQILGPAPDVLINDIATNPLTGKNMPPVFP